MDTKRFRVVLDALERLDIRDVTGIDTKAHPSGATEVSVTVVHGQGLYGQTALVEEHIWPTQPWDDSVPLSLHFMANALRKALNEASGS